MGVVRVWGVGDDGGSGGKGGDGDVDCSLGGSGCGDGGCGDFVGGLIGV